MTCDRRDVVAVPFPFGDRPGAKRRPALAVSNRQFNRAGHSVLCMITTKAEPPCPADHRIGDLAAAGLPAPCIVRLKLFTLDNRLLDKKLGSRGLLCNVPRGPRWPSRRPSRSRRLPPA